MRNPGRVVLKVSGEQLGEPGENFDVRRGMRVVNMIRALQESDYEVACVMGGGNVVRGASLAKNGFGDDVRADEMGMMATVMNGAFIEVLLEQQGIEATLLSNIDVPHIAETFSSKVGRSAMKKGRVVLVGGGTGKTGFTTDSGVVLAAHELGAATAVKTTKVNGVYTADPEKDSGAERIPKLTLQEAQADPNIAIMDKAALGYAATHRITICVTEDEPDAVLEVLAGEVNNRGSIVAPA